MTTPSKFAVIIGRGIESLAARTLAMSMLQFFTQAQSELNEIDQ